MSTKSHEKSYGCISDVYGKGLAVAPYHGGGKMTPDNARIAARANFECEYCGYNVLQGPWSFWHWQWDHIVPQNPKAGGPDTVENKALACYVCNRVKWKFNPKLHAREGATREELIGVARQYIQKRLAETQPAIDWLKERLL